MVNFLISKCLKAKCYVKYRVHLGELLFKILVMSSLTCSLSNAYK
jgi:hypothetical protein